MYGCLVKCGWHHAGINSGDSLAHEEFKRKYLKLMERILEPSSK
jgi:hypothetical protein